MSARAEFGWLAVGLGYQSSDGAGIDNVKSVDELGAALGLNFERFSGIASAAFQAQKNHPKVVNS